MSHSGGPVRTCVGCRVRTSRSSLMRLVADPASTEASTVSVVVDPSASAPGRGAWVHPRLDCLERAITRRAIARALRIPVTAEFSRVVEWFDQNIRVNR